MKPTSTISPLVAVLLLFLFCAAARSAASLLDDGEQAELDKLIGKTLWKEKQGGGAVDLDDAHLKGLIEFIEDNCDQKLKNTHTIADAFLWTAAEEDRPALGGRSRVTAWFEEKAQGNINGKGKEGEQNDYFVDVVITDKGEEFDFADLNPDIMCGGIHPYSPVERENDGDCVNQKDQNLKGDGQDRRQLGRCGNKLHNKKCLHNVDDAADVEAIDDIIASGYWLCGCDTSLCEKETDHYEYHMYEVALCCDQKSALFDFDLPSSPANIAQGKVGYHEYQDQKPGSTFCANYKGDVPESKAGSVVRGTETFKQMLFHSSFIRKDSTGGTTQICPGFTTHLWEKKVDPTPEGCWKLECGKPVSEVDEQRGKTFIEDTGITCPKTGKPGRKKGLQRCDT